MMPLSKTIIKLSLNSTGKLPPQRAQKFIANYQHSANDNQARSTVAVTPLYLRNIFRHVKQFNI